MKTPELLRLAYQAALGSPDPSTQNGALLAEPYSPHAATPIYRTLACNQFPRGVEYSEQRWERPLKYAVIEHAERNSLFKAARLGIGTQGMILVCPWSACADCARAIICCGITKLITHQQAFDRSPQRWVDSIGIAYTMLHEAGVEVESYDGFLGAGEILHNGESWIP